VIGHFLAGTASGLGNPRPGIYLWMSRPWVNFQDFLWLESIPIVTNRCISHTAHVSYLHWQFIVYKLKSLTEKKMLGFFSYQIILEKYVLFSNPNMNPTCIEFFYYLIV
jgi:hypothetical protein